MTKLWGGLVCLLWLCAHVADGATRDFKTRLQQQKEQIDSLRQRVLDIESSLVERNRQYIDGVKQSRKFNSMLQEVNEQLQTIEQAMAIESRKISTILRNYMIHSLDPAEVSSGQELYLEQLMTQGLLTKRKRYKKLQRELSALKTEARLLQQRVGDYLENEATLRSLITNLESEKGEVTRHFMDSQGKLRDLESHLAQDKAIQLLNEGSVEGEQVLLKMKSPLRSFSSLQKDKDRKGVVYRFEQRLPFYSGDQGWVQYLGRLANYGNLIIINHGNNIHSVLLGDINPQIKKGQQVTRGETIGQTKVRGQLYFEIRVKNKARNTLTWIDRGSLKMQVTPPRTTSVTAAPADDIAVKQRAASGACSLHVAGSDEAVGLQDHCRGEQLQIKRI